jgi:hypothetical protein
MSEFKKYSVKRIKEMRPYVPGEDLSGIIVENQETPELGGAIERNPNNHSEQWYVGKNYFQEELEEVLETETVAHLNTYGKKAVGLSFNPSGDDAVANCKLAFANEIDRMNDLRNSCELGEQKRLCSVAITELQTAQMWAVKALTWKD